MPLAVAMGRVRPDYLVGAGVFVVLFATGGVAWWHRPGHRAAWRLLLAGALISVALNLSVVLDATTGLAARPVGWAVDALATVAANLGLVALCDLLCSFPDGRYLSRWSRLVTAGGYLLAVVSATLTMLHPAPRVPLSTADPATVTRTPFGGPVVDLVGSWPTFDELLFILLPVAVVTMVLRYRGAGIEYRAQMRWPLAGAGVLAVVEVTSWTGLFDLFVAPSGAAAQVLWAAAVSAIPLGLLIGIVRHRLFDLQLALHRSAGYAAAWLLIAACYAAITALPGMAAGDRATPTAAVLLTVGAATLFQPVRHQLERLADRVIFGERISGYAMIRRLGTALETVMPTTDLAPRLAATVRHGLDTEWAAVRLRAPDGSSDDLAAVVGSRSTPPALVTELSVAGEPLGTLECGPRLRGHYTAEDHELLRTLGRQAALALANARLNEQLRMRLEQLDAQAIEVAASRTRLVTAEAAGRRQLERDIHDGVQQQLVSLMAKLTVARTQLSANPHAVQATLEAMQAEFRQVVADLRDLASGIHPAVLTDQGLAAAVVALAAKLPLPVSIDCAGDVTAGIDQQMEVAVYFGVAEALTNVVKHARASRACVRLARHDGCLTVEVSDDGRGFDTTTVARRGLAGLNDRLAALGGTLQLHTAPTGPTSIRMTVPESGKRHG